jgi:hypothetical protein
MAFRNLMANRLTIYRKGVGARDSEGYETSTFNLVPEMTQVPGRLVASSRSIVYKLEGTDVRASHQLFLGTSTLTGEAVDIQKDDKILDEATGVYYRVLEVHGALGRSRIHHYEGFVLEETSWQQDPVSS